MAEKGATEGIEVALNPEELDLDTAAMQAKYEQTVKEQQSQLEKEDLSDMLAEHAAKQKVGSVYDTVYDVGELMIIITFHTALVSTMRCFTVFR